jgi:integrase
MANRKSGARVLGPYHRPSRNKPWRLIVYDRGGERGFSDFETEADAKREAEKIARQFSRERSAEETCEQVITRYLDEKARTNKPSSVLTTGYRLRAFFGDSAPTLSLRALTAERCERLYRNLTNKTKADTHRNTLAEVRTWLSWCVRKRLLPNNPATRIEPEGRRVKGKPQLRLDESRRWLQFAQDLAAAGHREAFAAQLALVLGLRAGEVLGLAARDVDDGGRLLWISDAKTRAGVRRLEVPEHLQQPLEDIAKSTGREEKLFPWRRETLRKWVLKICRAAKVSEVTTHSLRGTHATIAEENGLSAHVVARALGHESIKTTREHYTSPEAVDTARRERVLKVLAGGLGKKNG